MNGDDDFWGCIGCGCFVFVIAPVCFILLVVVAKVLFLLASWVWNIV